MAAKKARTHQHWLLGLGQREGRREGAYLVRFKDALVPSVQGEGQDALHAFVVEAAQGLIQLLGGDGHRAQEPGRILMLVGQVADPGLRHQEVEDVFARRVAVVGIGIAGAHLLADQRTPLGAPMRSEVVHQMVGMVVLHLLSRIKSEEGAMVPAGIVVVVVDITVVEIPLLLHLRPEWRHHTRGAAGIGADRPGRVRGPHALDSVRQLAHAVGEHRRIFVVDVVALVVDRPEQDGRMIAVLTHQGELLVAPDRDQFLGRLLAAEHQPGPGALVGDTNAVAVRGIEPQLVEGGTVGTGYPRAMLVHEGNEAVGQGSVLGPIGHRSGVAATQPVGFVVEVETTIRTGLEGAEAHVQHPLLNGPTIADQTDTQSVEVGFVGGPQPW